MAVQPDLLWRDRGRRRGQRPAPDHGLLVIGPVAALLTGRWTLTAAASGLAIALGVALGIPDQIFATITQYTFLAAVAAVGTTATAGAAVLQHQRPRLPPG